MVNMMPAIVRMWPGPEYFRFDNCEHDVVGIGRVLGDSRIANRICELHAHPLSGTKIVIAVDRVTDDEEADRKALRGAVDALWTGAAART